MPDLDRAASDVPDEFITLVAHLDEINETLRLRNLEILRWFEEAVTAQVAQERLVADRDRQVAALTAELDAIRSTRAWRMMQPFRAVYRRIRGART